ncbi:MAG: LamG domain-containing protein, partial [Candidatus Aenigmatarchaeota archaeon]
MNKALSLLVVSVVVFSLCAATAHAGILEDIYTFLFGVPTGQVTGSDGLVLDVNFNDVTAQDVSGNGNTGVLSNVIWTSTGKKNGAFVFNGQNSSIATPSSTSLSFRDESFSVSAWFRPVNVFKGSSSEIVSRNGEWTIRITTSQIIFSFDAWRASINTTLTISKNLLNDWHFMIATYNKNTRKISLFLDGLYNEMLTTGTTSGWVPSDNVRIGNIYAGNRVFNGTIDEVKIWKRALSFQEMNDEYNAVSTTTTIMSCTKEGYSKSSINDVCCPGLVEIPYSLKQGDLCHTYPASYPVCAKCGNDICGPGENECNCPKDCPPTSTTIMTTIPAVCIDSDGGLNYYTKGIAYGMFGGEYSSYPDACCSGDRCDLSSGDSVLETYCEGVYIRTTIYKCPDGCSYGACLPTTTIAPSLNISGV